LAKFNGVKVNFELHLKECEWRWKKEAETLAKELWKCLKIKPSASLEPIKYLRHIKSLFEKIGMLYAYHSITAVCCTGVVVCKFEPICTEREFNV